MSERLKPRALVLTAPGINRDKATMAAYEKAGAHADIVHINALKSREVNLGEYQIFSIPGGFSYGDHIQAGRVLSLEFRNPVISDQIYEHLDKNRLILGVCNGFQVLVQSGLLPFGEIHSLKENTATLTRNQPNRFQSKWVHIAPRENCCKFIDTELVLNIPIASGEGRFLTINEETSQALEDNNQIVYQYCDSTGIVSESSETNINGSEKAIAAICDPSGQMVGMMPHAEDFVIPQHHPNWRRGGVEHPDGLKFFEQVVKAAKHL